MGFPIRDREFHTNALSKPNKDRRDQNVEDCALSNWADGVNVSWHRAALRVIEVTEQADAGVLVGIVPVLIDTMRGRDVEAKMIDGQHGTVWLLSASATKIFGRKFIPFGERSRVQRRLNLKQEMLPRPIKPFFASHCVGRGCPVQLLTIRDIPESWGL